MSGHGHGHVTPNADGLKARCGGPALCSTCAKEEAALLGGRAALAGVASVAVIRPDDVVIVTVGQDWLLVDALIDELGRLLGGRDRFLIISGDVEVGAVRPLRLGPQPARGSSP